MNGISKLDVTGGGYEDDIIEHEDVEVKVDNNVGFKDVS